MNVFMYGFLFPLVLGVTIMTAILQEQIEVRAYLFGYAAFIFSLIVFNSGRKDDKE